MATNDLSDVTGFVLREFAYKETSKIIEVFTREYGRISIIAKGVMGKKSKAIGSTQRFVKANYSLYKSGKDFYGIREASVIKSYKNSNRNYELILYKSAICDLLIKTLDVIQIDTVYKLLDKTFLAFENSTNNYINIFLAFLLKYISFSGFKPNLITCGICGKRVDPRNLYFSISESSLICNDHRMSVKDKIYLNPGEFTYLKEILYTSSEELENIKVPDNYKKIVVLIIDYTLSKLEIPRYSSIDWVYKNALERN